MSSPTDSAASAATANSAAPTQLPPPGWYPNPSGAGRRYWDGSQWTEHYDQTPQPQPQPLVVAQPAQAGTRPTVFWVAVGSIVAMAIGAFGPWVSALGGSVTVSGTSG